MECEDGGWREYGDGGMRDAECEVGVEGGRRGVDEGEWTREGEGEGESCILCAYYQGPLP